MGRNKKLNPFDIKPQLERQRIWDGSVHFGEHDNAIRRPVPVVTPDTSGASIAQDTVVRNREYYHWEAYKMDMFPLIRYISSPSRMYNAIAVWLIAYEKPQYEDSPTVSAFHGRTVEPALKVEPGYTLYEPGRKYSADTRMALYHKGTGKYLYGGTKLDCERWVNAHRDKHQLRRLIRIEVRVA